MPKKSLQLAKTISADDIAADLMIQNLRALRDNARDALNAFDQFQQGNADFTDEAMRELRFAVEEAENQLPFIFFKRSAIVAAVKQNAPDLAKLLKRAEKALEGDSNDAEHDALYDLVEALKVQQTPATCEITVTVEGGVIQSIDDVPPGVKVTVLDFDTDGVPDEETEVANDEGQRAVVSEYTAA